MKIKWNPADRLFEVEFTDFQTDLECVKAAGFKTTGPPEWRWHTSKASVLNKLRKNKPASGLTIMTDALSEYHKIQEIEEKNAEVKKALKIAKKERPGVEIDWDALEYTPDPIIKYVPPVWVGPRCIVCNSPVYFYEQQEPPCCLWCEKFLDIF